ncbi:MAG: mercuric transport protein MerTP [Flavobacteriaceae bacterium]|jgi:copper chaperone CopZ|nr:mercuric transport protein MerTP [Flavobacteriaceae bacterium]
MKNTTKLIATSIFAAIAASLCCITPLLVLFTGASSLATTFTWLEPIKPYLTILSIVVLLIAWYQKLQPQKQKNCNCDTSKKEPFIQTKLFLSFVTLFTLVIVSLPYTTPLFTSNPSKISSTTVLGQTVLFTIEGMTCEACTTHVNNQLSKLNGVIQYTTSFDSANSIIQFDPTKISTTEIQQAINTTGYTVISQKQQ